jgi:hypothetical protein
MRFGYGRTVVMVEPWVSKNLTGFVAMKNGYHGCLPGVRTWISK